MASKKRQHCVPRLLQRGFLARDGGDGERTWLHRRDMEPRPVGIRDIGVEDWFYSRRSVDGRPTLDDAIGEFERDLGPSVMALRDAEPGTAIDAGLAATTVAHLVTRTAHMRQILSNGMEDILDELETLLTDPARLGAMIGLGGPALTVSAHHAIRNSAADLERHGIPTAFSERLMLFMARELGDQLVRAASGALAPIFPILAADLAATVRNAHNKGLGNPLNGWTEALTVFDWTIEGARDLILPDAVALGHEGNGPLVPLLFISGADAQVVTMPLSPDRVLVGRRNDAVLDLARFNEEASAACQDFFIAARSFEREGLNDGIGTGPAELLASIISEAVREAERTRAISGCEIPPARPRELVQQSFNYTVRLADFGDEILAREYADIVEAVVASLARDLPLHDLDGITIAQDYAAALAGLDRGDSVLPSAASDALGYGQGVAKPVTVLREGRRKEHLVLAASLAATWISPDAAIFTAGVHSLVKMLAGIAHSTCYDGALATGFEPDPMARELHLAVAYCPSSYWSSRRAAFVAPDEGQTYAELVTESLAYAEREVAAARMHMANSSDVGRVTLLAFECVSAVLGHAADWLGHRDGLAEDQAFAGNDLPDRLKSRSLDRWIGLFGRDLAACYGPDDALDFSVVTSLGRHVERLLWFLGIYSWPEGEEVRCIVTDQPFHLPPISLPMAPCTRG